MINRVVCQRLSTRPFSAPETGYAGRRGKPVCSSSSCYNSVMTMNLKINVRPTHTLQQTTCSECRKATISTLRWIYKLLRSWENGLPRLFQLHYCRKPPWNFWMPWLWIQHRCAPAGWLEYGKGNFTIDSEKSSTHKQIKSEHEHDALTWRSCSEFQSHLIGYLLPA
jgi:hypothetical protein